MQKFDSLILNALKHYGYDVKDESVKSGSNRFFIMNNVLQNKEEIQFMRRLLICMRLLHYNLLISFYKRLTFDVKPKLFLDYFKDMYDLLLLLFIKYRLKDDKYYESEYEDMKKQMKL